MKSTLPNNLESEKALLSGLFFNPETIHEVRLTLTPEDFFGAVNRKIYTAMIGLADIDHPIEISVVSNALEKAGDLKKIGGNEVLMDLAGQTPTGQAVPIHAKSIMDLALRRRIMQTAGKIIETTHEALSGNEALDKAEAAIFGLRERRHLKIVGGNEAIVQAIKEIEKVHKAKGNLIGLPTSLDWLDRHTLGLCPGDLIVIGARPSAGKSTLMLQIAYHNAADKKRVLVVSLEMQPPRLMKRLLSAQSKLEFRDIKAAKLDAQGWTALSQATESIQSGGGPYLWFIDAHRCGITEIASVARHLSRSNGLDLVLIDYLQIINTSDIDLRKGVMQSEELDKVVKRSKALAKEVEVPLVLLSQIRREGDDAPNNRDLKGSGGIEETADIILLLHKDKENPSSVEFILSKQRDGETSKSPMFFDGAHQTFKGRIHDAIQW